MTERERQVLDTINRILATELESEQTVAADDAVAACEALDSVGLITLAVGLEDRFRVRLSEEDAPGLVTFGDVIRLVIRRREEAGQ
jgi:acyl carrier protein